MADLGELNSLQNVRTWKYVITLAPKSLVLTLLVLTGFFKKRSILLKVIRNISIENLDKNILQEELLP